MERKLERLHSSLIAQPVPSRHIRKETSSIWILDGLSSLMCQLLNTNTSRRAKLRSTSTEVADMVATDVVDMVVIDVVVTMETLLEVLNTKADVAAVVEAVVAVVLTNPTSSVFQTS